MNELFHTPLHALHVELGAKMVSFAGYAMPVQYPSGVLHEHLHTRSKAGLFDVSHMGQVRVEGADYITAATALETLIPVDILGLEPDRQRYGFFTNDAGGIQDDLMISNRGDHIFLVVNAGCKANDIAYLKARLSGVAVTEITDRALLALQGPAAETVLSTLNAKAGSMRFMDVASLSLAGVECWVSRSGYTGEDGYEISVPSAQAEAFARDLLAHPDVAPIGLGARDSLRLEAGLCLYGHDIDTDTTPVQAGLGWAIQKVRRNGGDRAGGFPGADVILAELGNGAARKRVGLLPEGRAPMREGVPLFAQVDDEIPIGMITSGGFGPTVGAPIAMGYVPTAQAVTGTRVFGELRGKRLPLTITSLPFTPANFKR
ncbi:glycine cleavage system aminomethyltransferase GcvT [Roseovarius sp. LXJ103]|uniref:glycine cleavage system aminomethyltransferase GcvT n=1 Tax=Roseovarius carneus TaxID=2853164 RepID=UPI000D6072B6|nr:glycine cleavage system aminomethyltransferase GcvT [Roseovarius carneus]MBZ8117025.1 glycine cleavage system aminomethyltransferase GcvT [Roseovarius carneus]PWE37123.1 glycine cleavage system aminomethyltransferase GcvT [Pelagicola sp. LXJ1103]